MTSHAFVSCLLPVALVTLVPCGLVAQSSSSPAPRPAQPVFETPARKPASKPPTTKDLPPPTAPPRQWSGLVRVGNAYDSNIDQNDTNNQAFGVIVGGGVQYVDDPADPSVTVNYETGLHRYQGTDRWDRISHYVRAQASQDLPGRFKADLIGEISLKGTTEERELSNQFNVISRLNLRIDRHHRVRFIGAWRERRYDETERHARNRYVGTEFTRRASGGHELSVDARYERNDAEGSRYQWTRVTYGAAYVLPVGRRGRLELDVTYRLVQYTSRTVEIDDEDVLRRDHRWTPAIVWRQAVTPLTELRFGYQRESRDSNDPRRDFGANQLIVGVTRRF
jgi:hypothetical protein